MGGTSLAPSSDMLTRTAFSFAFGALVLLTAGSASAGQVATLNPAVVCVPSLEQTSGDSTEPPNLLCLLRLSPWFERTSFQVTPRAASKRWGAAFALRF